LATVDDANDRAIVSHPCQGLTLFLTPRASLTAAQGIGDAVQLLTGPDRVTACVAGLSMNRHDRRAQEAQTRKSFTDYDAIYRRAFKKADDREIGEGWMRGAEAEANGIKAMIIHPTHEPPPPRSACDIELSAAYGEQKFQAFTKAEYLTTLQAGWPKFLDAARTQPDAPVTDDPRRDARAMIFENIVTNHQYASGLFSAITASAIIWLARTSPVGVAIGESHKRIHYEITDTETPGVRNYRLMLSY